MPRLGRFLIFNSKFEPDFLTDDTFLLLLGRYCEGDILRLPQKNSPKHAQQEEGHSTSAEHPRGPTTVRRCTGRLHPVIAAAAVLLVFFAALAALAAAVCCVLGNISSWLNIMEFARVL